MTRKLHLINTLIAANLSILIQPAAADTLDIGVSFAIPPYVIQANSSGLELDILTEALARSGHRATIHYQPLARTFRELQDGKLDGIINTQPHILDGVYYSEVVIRFQNCAFSLSGRKLSISSIADLKDKSVVAFQQAGRLLGDEFKPIAAQESYSEIAAQRNQVHVLFKGRTDVIIMERSIFGYYRKQEINSGFFDAQAPVDEHCIFPPTDYRFAFRSEKIRDDFNRGLRDISEDGTLDAIRSKYRDMLALPEER
ncbi:transporter substrate-binding domain-containing protein [Shewanella sp. JM162201]|uniref:Transporter substrate-binding domain-containing protein n=1 Tax=Shewanella jiangmenensis TaxID=2837387 RepID=A0ABS5UZT0_9GAMM|nr:transporter substrate-binding domain-containing protein [Shewanella jiangmenensis]MBT1443721.1 transporter substrate-binding domain-containing protein [Shewanella jiangmenensis]